jgi:hypothetical protein
MRVELKEHLEKQCQELNHEPQIENILVPNLGDDPVGITRKASGAFLSVKFDANRHKVIIRCDEPVSANGTRPRTRQRQFGPCRWVLSPQSVLICANEK